MGFRLSAGGFLIVIGNLITILFLFSPQGNANPIDTKYNHIVKESERQFWVAQFDSVLENGKMLIGTYPEKSEGYRILCMYWISENDWDRAIKFGKKAVKLDEHSGMAHHWLGRAYGRKAQNSSRFRAAFLVGKVKKHFKKAAELMPDYIRTHEDLFKFYSGSPRLAGGSRKKAEEELEHIVKLDPFRGSEMKAKYYFSIGNNEMAEKEIEKAIALDSADIDVRWTKTHILMNVNRISTRKQLRQIYLMSPQDSLKVFYQLGLTFLLEGDSLEAGIEIYNRYISSSNAPETTTYAASFWRRGMLYEKSGKYDRALIDYEESVKINSAFEPAKNALKKIKKKLR
ncbi:MAG: hypothetical protein IIB39_05120 [Candidatus Marinimicrobia bacterium]|nr:hypothetical protein [Candidatus Neomarinimicrobiota bacterium]